MTYCDLKYYLKKPKYHQWYTYTHQFEVWSKLLFVIKSGDPLIDNLLKEKSNLTTPFAF